MFDNLFELTKNQKILFYSAMISIIFQLISIYCLIDSKKSFKFDKCFLYILFSSLAYLHFYKIFIL